MTLFRSYGGKICNLDGVVVYLCPGLGALLYWAGNFHLLSMPEPIPWSPRSNLVLSAYLSAERPVADWNSLPLNQGRSHFLSPLRASREEPKHRKRWALQQPKSLFDGDAIVIILIFLKQHTFLHSWITAPWLCDPVVKTSRSITGISIGLFSSLWVASGVDQ